MSRYQPGGQCNQYRESGWGDGIMRIVYPKDFHLTLEVMHSAYHRHVQISTEKRPLLVYADSLASAAYDAQQFASPAGAVALVRGMAIAVKSFFTRAMADLFMRFHRPPYPTSVFASEQDAVRWLTTTSPEQVQIVPGSAGWCPSAWGARQLWLVCALMARLDNGL